MVAKVVRELNVDGVQLGLENMVGWLSGEGRDGGGASRVAAGMPATIKSIQNLSAQ